MATKDRADFWKCFAEYVELQIQTGIGYDGELIAADAGEHGVGSHLRAFLRQFVVKCEPECLKRFE